MSFFTKKRELIKKISELHDTNKHLLESVFKLRAANVKQFRENYKLRRENARLKKKIKEFEKNALHTLDKEL